MARELQALNRRFPPNAPIPGRGLPHPEALEIPTRQVRLARALCAFGTSLAGAGTLALGPAVVVAELGAGAPVLVAPAAVTSPPVLSFAVRTNEPFDPRLVDRARNDVRARSTVVAAGGTGSPRGKDDGFMVSSRGPLPGDGAAARLAGRAQRRLPRAGEVPALSRRPRPPPAAGGGTPHPLAARNAFDTGFVAAASVAPAGFLVPTGPKGAARHAASRHG